MCSQGFGCSALFWGDLCQETGDDEEWEDMKQVEGEAIQ